jgi:hypothetical protein
MAAAQQQQQQQPQGAQIPLQTFELPQFPAQAQGLLSLTLTSDIKLDEYTALLSQPYRVPGLPSSIQSLTLELFSLGYPPGFLTELIEELPDLKSLVIYSQLFAGISPDSQADAVCFFARATSLRALHLLDVFAQPHFFDRVAPGLSARERGLMFLEVNYTVRHEDRDFLSRIPGLELPLLVSPSLITCSLNVSIPDATNDPDDPSNLMADGAQLGRKNDGVRAFGEASGAALVQALTDEESAPRTLKALNTTLYTLSVSQLHTVLAKHKSLVVLNVTLGLEATGAFKAALVKAIAQCPRLEQVEIVGNPTADFPASPEGNGKVLADVCPSHDEMVALSKQCEKLTSFKANVLRAASWASVEWARTDGKWDGGLTLPTEPLDAEANEGGKQGSETWSPWT